MTRTLCFRILMTMVIGLVALTVTWPAYAAATDHVPPASAASVPHAAPASDAHLRPKVPPNHPAMPDASGGLSAQRTERTGTASTR